MVHVPTRGDVPVRLGPRAQQLPDYGPSVISRVPYTDPMQFELEREKVLGRAWLLAARTEQVKDTGDWISFESHGETVVITRQPDGSLAAFHNVCRHRGPSFVTDWQGCGARRFSCPYHGWVYDTTGELIGVPERDDFDSSLLAAQRPPAIAADEWGGFVWINLAGEDAPPLLDWIGPDITVDLGRFALDRMILHEKQVFDLDVSYKAVVDAFNEVYHANHLHHSGPEFAKSSRDTAFHLSGPNSMMFVPRPDRLAELAESGDHHRYTICHYVVFPNAVFNNNPDQIQVFNPIPIGPEKTRFILWELIYGPDDAESPEDYAAYFDATMVRWEKLKATIGEDRFMFEELAATKHSMGYRKNIFGDKECKITEYHRTMDYCVQGGNPMDRYGQEPTRGGQSS